VINGLLNYGYTVLAGEILKFVCGFRLDPYYEFIHKSQMKVFKIKINESTRRTLRQGRKPNMVCFPNHHSTTQKYGFSLYRVCQNDI